MVLKKHGPSWTTLEPPTPESNKSDSRTRTVATAPEDQPVFGGRHTAGLLHAPLASGSGFAIEAPRGHPGLERRLKGRDQRLKLGERQAGAMQARRGAGLQSSTADTSHAWCLLA